MGVDGSGLQHMCPGNELQYIELADSQVRHMQQLQGPNQTSVRHRARVSDILQSHRFAAMHPSPFACAHGLHERHPNIFQVDLHVRRVPA